MNVSTKHQVLRRNRDTDDPGDFIHSRLLETVR